MGLTARQSCRSALGHVTALIKADDFWYRHNTKSVQDTLEKDGQFVINQLAGRNA